MSTAKIERKYGKIHLSQDGKNWIITEMEPHVSIKLKQFFNRIPKHSALPYTIINTDENCNDLLWFMDRYPLDISAGDHKKMHGQRVNFAEYINKTEHIFTKEYVPRETHFIDGYHLRNYQSQAFDMYMIVKRLLVGDDLGLGKTVVGIASMLQAECSPTAVVCQGHLRSHWEEQIAKYTNLRVHLIKKAKAYDLPEADVYVFKYTSLSGWTEFFQTGFFKNAIFDECQELRRSESDKYYSCKVLSKSVEYCLGLSATPVYNYGSEIYNVLNCIKDNCLGDSESFYTEWCRSAGGYVYSSNGRSIAVSDPKALGAYLREQRLVLRRTRAEVGMELPPVNKQIIYVEHNDDDVDESEELAKQLAIGIFTGSYQERGQAALEFDIRLRQSTGLGKARAVATAVKLLLESGEKILLAGWHREVYDIWLKMLADYNPVMYTGSESERQKKEAKERFVNGDSRVMFMSLRSGVGVDGIQFVCNNVAFGELDHSPKVHEQFIARSDRPGQENKVNAYFFVSDYGSDPVMLERLGLKNYQSTNIMNPFETSVKENYSDDSRIKEMAKQFLKKHNIQIPQ